jgi:hypothetical protein
LGITGTTFKTRVDHALDIKIPAGAPLSPATPRIHDADGPAGNLYREKVPAGIFVGNGFGKLTGLTQVDEMGDLETQC